MKRTFSLTLIVAGMLIVFSALVWFSFDGVIRNPASVSLPDHLAGLPLTDQITGSQVASNFAMLHGKQFPLTSGAVGIYGNGQATFWVAGTPLKMMAARMVTDMQKKIAEGRSPFTPTGEFTENGRIVYLLEGMGQKHFYFQSGNLVIWLAADAGIADAALQQLQEFYP